MLDITDLIDRKPKQLSGGQRQRVAMGRAIVRNPKVFLFDEPLSNLDAKLRVQMRIEIKKVHQKVRTTTVYVTHDQVEAMTLADRVVVMNHGRIEQIDTPGQMYERPNTRFVADFLGTSNFIPVTIEAIGAAAMVRTESGLKLEAAPPAAGRIGDRLVLSLRPERVRLVEAGVAQALARGSVTEASFFGNAQRYVIRLQGGETLVATRPSLGEPMVPPGAQVGVRWSPSDLWIIPEPPA
jgi:ABC-type sugar transport system ATPase subunit